MKRYPSRSEERETLLFQTAEKGNLSVADVVLYQREIEKLRRDGFEVFNIKPFLKHNSKSLYSATISWENAYGNWVPHLVYRYINKKVKTYPKKYIRNLAQQLYVISQTPD